LKSRTADFNMPKRLQNLHPMSDRVQVQRRDEQQGVVLVMALIMLVVISLLATLSMRNATSTESISGNVRTTELATQAAEIALRYCEEAVAQSIGWPGTLNPLPFIPAFSSTPLWSAKNGSGVLTNWDGAASTAVPASPTGPVLVIPDSSINQAGAGVTFKRPPECMVERMQMAKTNTTVTTTTTFVITARGFGPDVAADISGVRPRPKRGSEDSTERGSEVWMQSTIELNPPP
jgi:type IV pilus assembly protein PilX